MWVTSSVAFSVFTLSTFPRAIVSVTKPSEDMIPPTLCEDLLVSI